MAHPHTRAPTAPTAPDDPSLVCLVVGPTTATLCVLLRIYESPFRLCNVKRSGNSMVGKDQQVENDLDDVKIQSCMVDPRDNDG